MLSSFKVDFLTYAFWQSYVSRHRRYQYLNAAREGDLQKLSFHISQWQLGLLEDFDITCVDKSGSNALMLAAWSNQREALLLLLHAGLHVDTLSNQGWPALTYAARQGSEATLKVLLEWGSDPNVQEDTMKATPLMFAAYVGSLECVELLLEKGANPLIANSDGALAFMFAEESGHSGIAGMLRHKAAEAQAEEQALKEQQEALITRQKARKAQTERKRKQLLTAEKSAKADKKKEEMIRKYQGCFGGQLEILSVGCFVPFNISTASALMKIMSSQQLEDMINNSTGKKTELPVKKKLGSLCETRANAKNTNVYENSLAAFRPLHADMLRRRCLNALTRNFKSMSVMYEEGSSGEEDEESDSDSGSGSGSDDNVTHNMDTQLKKMGDNNNLSIKTRLPKLRISSPEFNPRLGLNSARYEPLQRLALDDRLQENEEIKSKQQGNTRGRDVNNYNRLNRIIDLLKEAFVYISKSDSNMTVEIEGACDRIRNRLRTVATAIRFGPDKNKLKKHQINPSTPVERRIQFEKLMVHIVCGLGEMAKSYLHSSRQAMPPNISNLHLFMPYFLQVEPQTIIPLAALLHLTTREAELEMASSAKRQTKDGTNIWESAIVGCLWLIKAHLKTIAVYRLETRKYRASLAKLKDEMLYVSFSSPIFSLCEVGNRKENPETNDINKQVGSLSAEILFSYLNVLVPDIHDRQHMLIDMWKENMDEGDDIFSNKACQQVMRQLVSESLMKERSISYLVCPDIDCPAPCGGSLAPREHLSKYSHQRVGDVLGVSFGWRRNGMKHTASSYNVLNSPGVMYTPGLSRRKRTNSFNDPHFHKASTPQYTGSGEHFNDITTPLTPGLVGQRSRSASLARRDSTLRVRATLGDNRLKSNSLLKRRSKALMTLQRVCRRFVQAGRENRNRRQRVSSTRQAKRKQSVNDVLENGSMSQRYKNPTSLDDLEELLCVESDGLLHDSIPTSIVDWIESQQDILDGLKKGYIAESSEWGDTGLLDNSISEEVTLGLGNTFTKEPIIESDSWRRFKSSQRRKQVNYNFDTTCISDEGKHFLRILTELVVRQGDVSSAVVLRCLQDDLVSRVFVVFEDDDGDISPFISANVSNSCSGPSSSDEFLSVLLKETRNGTNASVVLLEHTCELISICIKEPEKAKNTKHVVSGVGVDVCCELLERLIVLSDWKRGAFVLGPILWKIISLGKESGENDTRNLEPLVRSSTKLLCSFAGAMISSLPNLYLNQNRQVQSSNAEIPGTPSSVITNATVVTNRSDFTWANAVPAPLNENKTDTIGSNSLNHQNEGPFDEKIEELLKGELFTGTVSTDVPKEESEFCQSLIASDDSETLDGMNETHLLHRLVSKLPVIRLSIPPIPARESMVRAVNHAVRSVVAALLKHSACTQSAMALLKVIKSNEEFRLNNSDLNTDLQLIWRTAWTMSKNILSTHRKMQKKACVECEKIVIQAEDNSGKWRCESGHENDSYNIIDGQSLDSICMQIIERARVLLNQPTSLGLGSRSRGIKLVVEHGKRFIESSLSDNIDSQYLVQYLKAKDELCFVREWGLRTFASVFRTIASQQQQLSTDITNVDNGQTDGLLKHSISLFLVFVKSMPTPKDSLGHHYLDYIFPSKFSVNVQQSAFLVLETLLDAFEANVRMVQSQSLFQSQDSDPVRLKQHISLQLGILEVLQAFTLWRIDNEKVANLRLLPRLMDAQEFYSGKDLGVNASLWLVNVRFVLQILVNNNTAFITKDSDQHDVESCQGKLLKDIKVCFANYDRPENLANLSGFEVYDRVQCETIIRVVLSVHKYVTEMALQSCSSEKYVDSELECYRWVCILGSVLNVSVNVGVSWLCSNLDVGDIVDMDKSTGTGYNLLLSLIECGSPRIQMLALRLGRRLLISASTCVNKDSENNDRGKEVVAQLTNRLFYLSGSWALTFQTGAKNRVHLALECATLLRYLACRNDVWKVAVMNRVRESCTDFLALKQRNIETKLPDKDLNKSTAIVFNFWMALAIMVEMTSPPTLRVGTRVKYMRPSPTDGHNHYDYGILIRASESPPVCAVVLDTDNPSFPIVCDTENIFPVTKASKYRNELDFFGLLRNVGLGYEWLLDTIECFTSSVDDMNAISGQQCMIWDELQSMVVSSLHAWLISDSEAVAVISTQRSIIWKYIVEMCALTAPAVPAALVNVSDLDSTEQAAADFRGLLFELDIINLSENGLALLPEAKINTADSSFKYCQAKILHNLVRLISVRNITSTDGDFPANEDLQSENTGPESNEALNDGDRFRRESLLSAPELKSGSRAALARQTSSLIFKAQINEDNSDAGDDNSENLQVEETENNFIADNYHKQGEGGEGEGDVNPSKRARASSNSSSLKRHSTSELADGIKLHKSKMNDTLNAGLIAGMSSSFREKGDRILDSTASCSAALQVERNRRRARQDRRLRVTQHFRSLSKTPSAKRHKNVSRNLNFDALSFDADYNPEEMNHVDFREVDNEAGHVHAHAHDGFFGYPYEPPEMNINDTPLTLTAPTQSAVSGSVSGRISRCQPDTPRGKDAVMSLAIPVELPTVDTLGLGLGPKKSSSMRSQSSYASPSIPTGKVSMTGFDSVIKIGAFVRISAIENGCVETIEMDSSSNALLALIRIVNLNTGYVRKEWFDLGSLESMEDVIASRYRAVLDDSIRNDLSRSRSDSLNYTGQMETDANKGDKNKKGSRHRNLSIDTTEENVVSSRIFEELHFMRVRAAILHARRVALAAISTSIDKNLPLTMLMSNISRSSDPGQIIGMLKLCQSSLSSLTFQVDEQPIWDAAKHLFKTNVQFADMLIDEATLLLSLSCYETLTFESPHPLCPVEETSVEEEEEEEEEEKTSQTDACGDVQEQSLSIPPHTDGSESPRITGEQKHELFRANSSMSLQLSQDEDENENDRSSSKKSHIDDTISKFRKRQRRLSGSRRFHIKGASGLLVEFDQRSCILESATQVTLSYDPQDRQVIKVIGEGGASAWHPVVVSGDSCYIHWQVDASTIHEAIDRAKNLGIDDLEKVAWGFGVRVRCLDDVTNVDEKQVLKRSFGWKLLQVLAVSPSRVLERKKAGLRFFRTAISYLRFEHVACKAQLCEMLTQLVGAYMQIYVDETGKSNEKHELEKIAWKNTLKRGLYKLHYDLLVLFDDVSEDGYTSVSPYFECLLELLVSCRELWAADVIMDKSDESSDLDSNANMVVPLCTIVTYGKRKSSKIVVSCETCGLTDDDDGICLACAAHCHKGHVLRRERSAKISCACSRTGSPLCRSLAPKADIWNIRTSERTWFDTVCQTTDVINRICCQPKDQGKKSSKLPISFVSESFKTCEDGRILRHCLRSLEECLRSEAQEDWWSRDSRRRWANALDAGLDTVAEVSFGLVVLESSMLESSFAPWWPKLRRKWQNLVLTNQAWALAQAMLNFQFALHSSSCYPEWDSRQNGWVATLEGITGLGGEHVCTYLLSGDFPRPQLFRKCRDCKDLEICEYCAVTKHASHNLSKDIFGPGFCDEKTNLETCLTIPKAIKQRDRYKRFSRFSKMNFEWLRVCYWVSEKPVKARDVRDEELPTEPRTLAALLNIPRTIFAAKGDSKNVKTKSKYLKSKLTKCVQRPIPDSHLLSASLEGILIELLGVKENMKALTVGCGSDDGFSLALIAFLVHGGRVSTEEFGGVVHGFDNSLEINQNLQTNFNVLEKEYGIRFGKIELFTGDLYKHIFASKANRDHSTEGKVNNKDVLPGLLSKYECIYCNGLCSLRDLEAMSSLLALDGVLLCPLVAELGYGVYVQRNRFNGQCESRTLAPLFEKGSSFLGEIKKMRMVKFKQDEESVDSFDQVDPSKQAQIMDEAENRAKKNRNCGQESIVLCKMKSANDDDDDGLALNSYELKQKVADSSGIESWGALGELINKIPGRENNTLGFRDISHTSLEPFPRLQEVDINVIRGRFAVLKRINESLKEVLPLIRLTPHLNHLNYGGGIGKLLSTYHPKRLIFLSTKLEAWSKILEPSWSRAPISAMPAVTVSRHLAESSDSEDSLFMQTFYQIQNYPTCTLQRRDQAFRVRFAGEGGHDVGGLYRDLFTEMCTELREKRPNVFFTPPNAKARGETLLPKPSLNSKIDKKIFEYIGTLMGICTLRHGATLALDLNPLLWKSLVGDELSERSLSDIDEVAAQQINFIRNSKLEELEYVFQDTFFTTIRSDTNNELDRNRIYELCPFGVERKVTASNVLEYADLLVKFRLREYENQINMLRQGISSIVPVRLLPMFTWQELEHLICGVADVDVEMLQNQTKYVGGVSQTDAHITFFWDVIANEFTPEDRTQFLKFVWGRERMSNVEEGVNVFQIGPHVRSVNSGNPDMWLPVAHTCFFSLDLPAYTSREITKSKLLFAMNNCNAIDADDDGEGHANMGLTLEDEA